MLLETAEAARSGSSEAEATTPAKQLLPPAVGAGDLAAETDVSCCLGFAACCCTCKHQLVSSLCVHGLCTTGQPIQADKLYAGLDWVQEGLREAHEILQQLNTLANEDPLSAPAAPAAAAAAEVDVAAPAGVEEGEEEESPSEV